MHECEGGTAPDETTQDPLGPAVTSIEGEVDIGVDILCVDKNGEMNFSPSSPRCPGRGEKSS